MERRGGEKEAEEGVELESRQTWALGGPESGRVKPFSSTRNVHGLDGQRAGLTRKAIVMGSKEWAFAGPTGVEEGEGVGERRAWLKRKARLTSSSLSWWRRVHDEQRDAGSEEFLRGGMSFRMFHSGCGGAGGPKPRSP